MATSAATAAFPFHDDELLGRVIVNEAQLAVHETQLNSKSVTIGESASTGNTETVAIGEQANASTYTSSAVGAYCTATNVLGSYSFGYGSDATGTYAVAVGKSHTASGTNAVCVGYENEVTHAYGTIIGNSIGTSAPNQIALKASELAWTLPANSGFFIDPAVVREVAHGVGVGVLVMNTNGEVTRSTT